MKESSENIFVERRRFPRYPCTGAAEVLVIQSGKSRRWGTVKDISRVGCYIETMYPLPAGAEVELRFTLAGVALDIAANVVSSHPMFGMGVDFAGPAEKWKVSQIIAKLTNTDISPAMQTNEASHEEPSQPHMQAALQHLEQAQKELQGARHDKDGHSAQALRLAEDAINEAKKVIAKEEKPHTQIFDSAYLGDEVVLRDALFEQWLASGL
jgi:hypothetical protein